MAEGNNVIQSASMGVRGALSRPVSEAVAANELEEKKPIIVSGGEVTQSRESGTELSHVDHAMIRRSRQGREINPSWGRVNVTKSKPPITHSDLNELKGDVIVSRAAEELVGYR